MIQFVLNCDQTRLNVSKAVLRSVLSKTHHEKLIVVGQIPGTIDTLVSGDACVEVSTRISDISWANTVFPVNIGGRINWSIQIYDSSRVHENPFVIN